ncbi:MAG TPA: cation:proton antiporter [Gemmatimonadales bacterium]|nr:cation:proton antiporter [Gemmatimonadales bacterium]
MRAVVSLIVVAVMMALFHHLTAGGLLEARATLALGFLLIASQLGADIVSRWKLPRLTGYLLTGFVFGPAWLGFVRADEVRVLDFIADAAVALIAFSAGSELVLGELRAQRPRLTRLSLGAIGFPFVAVTGAILILSPWFPLAHHQPLGNVVAIAVVLGTCAAAFSPAATIAIMDETGARGPFARGILNLTVIGDVSLILLLTLVLELARPLAQVGAVDVSAVLAALLGIGASVGAGMILGWVVARYLQAVRRDTALFLVALACVTAELARLLHLEALLIALAAGFYLENFSPVEGERLRAELRRGSRPVYAVFFALAGASIHLDALGEMLPWVVLLVVLRALALRAGFRWAGRSPAVEPQFAEWGWMGAVSQAGIALGLALVARRSFPEWGVSLGALIVTMIGVHEAVGPVLFKRALGAVGELKEREGDAQPAVADSGVMHGAPL